MRKRTRAELVQEEKGWNMSLIHSKAGVKKEGFWPVHVERGDA